MFQISIIKDQKGSPLFETDNPGKVKLTGSSIEEQLSNTDAVDNVLTFTKPITAAEIIHEEVTWQTFIVNGISLKLPKGIWSRSVGGTPSTEVTIPAGINCAVGRLI